MTLDQDKQWRIDNASHLKGLPLQHRSYAQWSDSWDHDHCAACWAKLSERGGAAAAYATGNDHPKGACYEWVCQTCFNDLKIDMQWSASSR